MFSKQNVYLIVLTTNITIVTVVFELNYIHNKFEYK